MKKTFTLGTLLLGCCLAAAAQMGSTPNQIPQRSTPPTFPQDQTGQTPSNPTTPADPSAIPPDTSAPGQPSRDHASDHASPASNSQTTTIQGCLSQSKSGSFMLADNSGTSFQLRGENSQLSSYIGNEVKVEGVAMSKGGSIAGSMSSPDASSSDSAQFSVSDIHKVADACAVGTKTNK